MSGIIVLILVTVGLLTIASYGIGRIGVQEQSATAYGPPVQVDLGQLDDLGSSGQAIQILFLMQQYPGRSGYSISYETPADTVVFGCDLAKRVIARIHQYKDGRGTAERWTGYVIERLNSAAAGGSLNETPAGNQPGTFEAF